MKQRGGTRSKGNGLHCEDYLSCCGPGDKTSKSCSESSLFIHISTVLTVGILVSKKLHAS